MSKQTVIKVENLSKQYRLGNIGTGTVSHDINRFFAKIRGKEDPFLKIGETNDRSKKGNSDLVWALKDINFEVQQGEILGIIGKNGAGKSTLLKILSKVTGPTTGSIKAKGRIASLLEVGTGFHPELTGRENIFLNGAILGMNKLEIRSKLDEIVDFAGIERYLDTPVKRYSSGMMVRLGFAVAAHLEPEILVVDEVLAVGDAEFQKKAIGKMQDVSANQGRTVLFVSHNMASVKALCNKGILMQQGCIEFDGEIDQTIDFYLKNENEKCQFKGTTDWAKQTDRPGTDHFKLNKVFTSLTGGDITGVFSNEDEIFVHVEAEVLNELRNMRLNFKLLDKNDVIVFTTSSHSFEDSTKKIGIYNYTIRIPANLLNHGVYFIELQAGIPNIKQILLRTKVLSFDIEKLTASGTTLTTVLPGVIAPKIDWIINQ
jgi:lipopolysaccharide transport system ATP-binding protein